MALSESIDFSRGFGSDRRKEPVTYSILFDGKMLALGVKRDEYTGSYSGWFFPNGISGQKTWVNFSDLKFVKTIPANKTATKTEVWALEKDLSKFNVSMTRNGSTHTITVFAFNTAEAERKAKLRYAKNYNVSVALVMSWFKNHTDLIKTERVK